MIPLAEWLVRGDAQRIIAIDGHEAITLQQWRARVQGLVATLQSHPAQRFLLAHSDTLLFATGFFALLHAGKDIVLPPNTQPGTLAAMQAEASALLGEGKCALPCLSITAGETANTITLQPFDAQARTVTVMTSGSTGVAKRITKAVACLDAEIAGLEAQWGARLGNATVLSTVSHQHIYGLLFRLLWPLASGRAFVVRTFGFPEPLYAALKAQACAVLVSSPSQLKRFPDALDLGAIASRITAVFSSGGPLPRDAALDWESRLGQSPIEVLGSSETGGVAWRSQTSREASTPWQAFKAVRISLTDNCLTVDSPFTGLDTPFVMGDRAELLDNKHFHLLGRTDTIVKIEEKRVSLTAMEKALAASALVAEARVVPLPDSPNRLGAVVVLSPQGQAQLHDSSRRAMGNQLRDCLLSLFERVLLPRKWRFVNALPVNSQGKTTVHDLQHYFMQDDFIRIKDETADRRMLDITPRDEHFEGHFPGLPILAGVRQFDWAVHACKPWYQPEQFAGIRRLKFSNPITPGKPLTLTLQQQAGDCVQFSYHCNGKLMSSGLIVFKA